MSLCTSRRSRPIAPARVRSKAGGPVPPVMAESRRSPCGGITPGRGGDALPRYPRDLPSEVAEQRWNTGKQCSPGCIKIDQLQGIEIALEKPGVTAHRSIGCADKRCGACGTTRQLEQHFPVGLDLENPGAAVNFGQPAQASLKSQLERLLKLAMDHLQIAQACTAHDLASQAYPFLRERHPLSSGHVSKKLMSPGAATVEDEQWLERRDRITAHPVAGQQYRPSRVNSGVNNGLGFSQGREFIALLFQRLHQQIDIRMRMKSKPGGRWPQYRAEHVRPSTGVCERLYGCSRFSQRILPPRLKARQVWSPPHNHLPVSADLCRRHAADACPLSIKG